MGTKSDISKQSSGTIIFLTVVFLGMAWLRSHQFPHLQAGSNSGPGMSLGQLLEGWLSGATVWTTVLWLLLIAVNGTMLSVFTLRNMLVQNRSFLPLLFYTMTAVLVPFSDPHTMAVLLSATLVIGGIMRLSASFTRAVNFPASFGGGFLLGLAPLVFAPSVIYVLLAPVAMRLFRRSARETAVCLFALTLPVLLWAYVQWWMDTGFTQVFTQLWKCIATPGAVGWVLPAGPGDIIFYTAAGTLMLTGLISVISYFMSRYGMRTRAYRNGLFMVLTLVITLGGVALPCSSPGHLPLMAVPLAVLPLFFFRRFTGWFPVSLFLLVVLSVAAFLLHPFFY